VVAFWIAKKREAKRDYLKIHQKGLVPLDRDFLWKMIWFLCG